MSRYVYYQPNKKDLKDKYGDCQIRALSKALGLSWLETYDLTDPICRELQSYTIFGCELNKVKEAMARLGFTYTGVSNKRGTKRPTVESFARTHKEGTFIVTVAHHVVAVVDGKYFDTWDSGRCSLYGYYELIGEPEKPEGDYEYRVRAYFNSDSYGPRSYKRKVVSTEEDAKRLLEEALEYYASYKYLDRVVIEKRRVEGWA